MTRTFRWTTVVGLFFVFAASAGHAQGTNGGTTTVTLPRLGNLPPVPPQFQPQVQTLSSKLWRE
jgi:hypothetical protein